MASTYTSTSQPSAITLKGAMEIADVDKGRKIQKGLKPLPRKNWWARILMRHGRREMLN
jgi:hypothetical protein